VTVGSADLTHLLIAVALLLAAAHAIGSAFAALRLPRVIGEIAAGLILGPTCFGAIAPGLQQQAFPRAGVTATSLGVIYQLGLLLLLFCSGVETRAVFRRGDERAVGAITVVGMALPFALGFGVVQLLHTSSLEGTAHSDAALVLVFALAIAVTSIPVISRIMFDLGILHTSFARVVLAVAVVEDTVVYVLLAIALGLAGSASGAAPFGLQAALGIAPSSAAAVVFHVAATLALFPLALRAVPRLLAKALSRTERWRGTASPVAIQLLFILVIAIACLLLGIVPMLGAFLAGIVLGSLPGKAGASARGAIKDFSFGLFIPVYFAVVGLQLDLLHHFDPLFFLCFLVFACAAKALSVYAGARIGGEGPRAALNLAVALNARGGPGIVLASVTYAAGIINQEFFACLVLLAIITSLLAGSWLGRTVRRGDPLRPSSGIETGRVRGIRPRPKASHGASARGQQPA
jgi:K+:H+ antiporter